MLMMTMLMWLWTHDHTENWQFKETEIYRNIRQHQIAGNDAGEIFVIDSKEKQILKISHNGQTAIRFGRRGTGPGEFRSPMQIKADQHRLYVYDSSTRKILVFDSQGAYLEEHLFTGSPLLILKTSGGWLTQEVLRDSLGARDFQVNWYDQSGGKPTVIYAPEPGKFPAKRKADPNSSYNPTPSRIQIAQSVTANKFVLVYPGTQPKITIHDSQTGELQHTFSEKRHPIPFNEAWAEARHQARQEALEEARLLPAGRRIRTPDFPDFFPFAKKLWVFEDDRIYVDVWTGNPEKGTELWSFNFQGERVETSLNPSLLYRVISMNQTHAWVFKMDKERDEIAIAKIDRSQLARQ